MLGRSSRLEAFSDGVFAVAITLLVLQITIPKAESGQLLGALLKQWPLLATYAASFLTIGVMWLNHHSVFAQLRGVDRTLRFLNLVLLLWIVLVPFPTALLGEYLQGGHDAHDTQVAAAAYGLVMTLQAVTFSGIWAYVAARPALLREGVDPAQARATLPRFAFGTVVYAASIGLAWLSPLIALALYAALPIYYAFEQIQLTVQEDELGG